MKVLASTLAALAAIALSACGGGSSGTVTPATVMAPTPMPGSTSMPGSAPASAAMVTDKNQGGTQTALVNPSNGLPLYTWAGDTANAGTSNCTGACASSWPPFLAPAGAQASGNFTLITRSDTSSKQWASKGMPLYMFAGDSQADVSNGNGLKEFGSCSGGCLWSLATP